jgi:flagellum-specific peptidoglycan hydrolase FlgJ
MGVFPASVIAAAKAAQKAHKVPASVSLAQWAIESGWGKHMPPGSNNPFGMKVRKNKNDPFVEVKTREVIKGKTIYIMAKFRKFTSIEEAFLAKGLLLSTAPVYAKAFAKLPDVTAFVDAFAPIYATDPSYAKLIKSVITSNNLSQYNT